MFGLETLALSGKAIEAHARLLERGIALDVERLLTVAFSRQALKGMVQMIKARQDLVPLSEATIAIAARLVEDHVGRLQRKPDLLPNQRLEPGAETACQRHRWASPRSCWSLWAQL
jgi:hypothetical protein